MKIDRCAFIVALAGACIAGSQPERADADASPPLRQTLGTLRGLWSQSFGNVVQWARAGAPQIINPIEDYERAELQILNLGNDDRQAVLWWLQGNGRSALYNRGASDDQIGPPRSGIDNGAGPAPTATPNPWRDLKLASATLDTGTPASQIVLLGGFAGAKRDGTSAMACVSFKNVAAATATRVVFTFPLLGPGGDVLAALTLDRRGTFSSGVGIMSYDSLSDATQNSGVQNRGYSDNCTTLTNAIAAVPILKARFATYRVTRVEYSDGSVWPGH
ncbi:MAG: hypothetical protein M3R53_00825 [Candidatus Eremiobacteraeota bacterium]|nr:hypothetical protein [Candidatus Eremiobacteraeota bacterium]